MITLETLVELNKRLSGMATIAGGCFRSLIEGNEPKDIDIFLYKKDFADGVRDAIKLFTGLDEVETTYSWEYGKYTIIKPYVNNGRNLYGSPITIVSQFDIDVTKLWMDLFGNVATVEPYTVEQLTENIQNRQCEIILFNGHENRTVKRINKYIGYGYNISQIESRDLPMSAFYIEEDNVIFDTQCTGLSYI